MSSTCIIARAYANAVFDISIEQKNIEEWKSFLELLVQVSFCDLVRSLFFRSLEVKKLSKLFIVICEDIQKKQIGIFFKNFICIISEKNRFSLLPIILKEFNYLYFMYYKCIVKVEVISAWPLSDSQIKKIVVVMTKRYSKTVNVINTINKNIFSGIIVRVGNIVIDGSIYGRMLRLKNYILKS